MQRRLRKISPRRLDVGARRDQSGNQVGVYESMADDAYRVKKNVDISAGVGAESE